MWAALKYWQIGAGFLLGALAAFAPVYFYGKSDGRSEFKSEIAEASVQAEKERVKHDAQLQNLSDYELCVRSLKRRGLRFDPCSELRGVSSE